MAMFFTLLDIETRNGNGNRSALERIELRHAGWRGGFGGADSNDGKETDGERSVVVVVVEVVVVAAAAAAAGRNRHADCVRCVSRQEGGGTVTVIGSEIVRIAAV